MTKDIDKIAEDRGKERFHLKTSLEHRFSRLSTNRSTGYFGKSEGC